MNKETEAQQEEAAPCSAKMDSSEKDSGRWLDMPCLLLTFPELFWLVVLIVFLTRTSCCRTTHPNSYYGAWPGWAVQVSVLPLTVRLIPADNLGVSQYLSIEL